MFRPYRWLALLTALILTGTIVPAHAAPRVTLLAYGFGEPDDLAWAPHGAIYFSDFGNGSVNLLAPDGTRRVVRAGLGEPEGIVVDPGGTLIVAEQRANRILRFVPAGGPIQVLAILPNTTGQTGIDGIARDPRDGSIIIPDSPHGRLLRLSAHGAASVVATGLGRPVGALVQSDGTILVVDEHRTTAFKISPRSVVTTFGSGLQTPDDIVSDGGTGFYVTCLGDGTVRHLDPLGRVTLVASGFRSPQGLLRRADGTLIVADEVANTIMAVHP
jgi:sugar lactone lactonase YvrE